MLTKYDVTNVTFFQYDKTFTWPLDFGIQQDTINYQILACSSDFNVTIDLYRAVHIYTNTEYHITLDNSVTRCKLIFKIHFDDLHKNINLNKRRGPQALMVTWVSETALTSRWKGSYLQPHPHGKVSCLSFEKNFIFLTKECSVPISFEIGPVVLKCKMNCEKFADGQTDNRQQTRGPWATSLTWENSSNHYTNMITS